MRKQMTASIQRPPSHREARLLPDWLSGYMEFVKHTEPPPAFHRWTAMGCVAAALQRHCYMDWGHERIYSNLYICLLGDAALTRKSTAIKIGEVLVKSLNIPMIGQSNSPEAVTRDMKNSAKQFFEQQTVKNQSAACCFASEMAVFLGRQNISFQANLTDWFDSPDEWKYTTKHQGVDDISGLCFNLVGGMAPDWIPHIFAPESIGGGFTSRILFIHESRKGQTVADPNLYPTDHKLRRALESDLEKISTLIGPFHLADDARKHYVNWYERQDKLMAKGQFPVPDSNFRHYCGRRGTLVRKLCISISAARGDSRIVSLADIKWALAQMEDIESRMVGIFASVGRSTTAYQGALVRSTLALRGRMLRSDLLKEVYSDVSLKDLEDIERTLAAAKLIKINILPDKHDTLYRWIG